MLTLDFQCHYAGDTSLFDRFPSLKPVRLKLAVPIVSYQSDGSTGLQWVHHDAEPVSDTHLLDQASHQFHLPARTITGSNPGLFLRYFAERIAGLFLPQPYYDATIALPVPELVRQMSLRSVIEITTAQSKNHSQIRDFNLLPLLVTGDVVNPADDAAIATLNEYLTPLGRTRHADRKVANNVLLINADALQDLFRSGDPRSLLWVLLHGLNGKGQLLSLSDVQHRFDVLKTPNHEDDDIPSPQQKLEDAYEAVAANLSALLSWPLSFTPIPVLDVGGKFSIKSDKVLLPANFSSNALSLRFQSEVLVPGQFPGNSPGGVRSIETTVIEYDWQLTPAAIKDNTVSFAFDQEPLLAQHIISPVTVRVQGFDGVDLWQKEFDKDDPALAHLHIAVALYVPAALRKPTALQNERGIKLRGQVVDATSGKVVVKGLTVMLQAKLQKTDSAWLTVGAASTDGMGNFSMDYPLGVFVAAQALVSSSAVQSAPVPIQVKTDMDAVNKQKTLDEGFIFLVLQAGADENDSVGENCDCHHPRTAGRLPDHADLMASDEYSQDVGTGCITLTTPNRTLSEHAYLAIVRTSDPDVANYELKRETVLDGMQKNVIKFSLGNGNKIKRGNIDLFNPVRWQDDPSDPDPLSFYQSVTVAHGHVLRYKAVWKADGYSLGDLLYSLPLAPGQKKQIVINELSRSLAGGEQQQISQSESLAANLFSERTIVDTLAGSISENLRGNSSSSTGGVSVSAGASYLGMANIGVSGGYSKSDSDASQDSGRNIAQNFEEKIRHNTMQNAQSYRQNNAAVVTTVGENQKFSTQVEVVANHNHCHSMTMMYFEVLRHYAVFQELSAVEECIFIPLLMTTFTRENVVKWRDTLAANLLYRPSSTYLPAAIGENALVKAFDANSRIQTNYENVDYPQGSFADDPIAQIQGEMWVRVNFIRPFSHYDRIKNWPIVEQTRHDPGSAFIGLFFGLFFGALFGMASDKKVDAVNAKIDEYMDLDSDYETKPPAQAIRIKKFDNSFFNNDQTALEAWTGYASLLGRGTAVQLLREFFQDRPIAQWDEIFHSEIVPKLARKLGDKFRLAPFSADFTLMSNYYGGEQSLLFAIQGQRTNLTRRQINKIVLGIEATGLMKSATPIMVESLSLYYSTAHFKGVLFNGAVRNDLDVLDPVTLDTPPTSDELRDPRLEDRYLVQELMEHLNSNLEYYNKTLWYNLDPDRRYLLLDGFHIQVYDDFNQPSVYKSLASVVRNELVGVVGNSLVFPVAPGFKLDRSYVIAVRKEGDTETVEQISLFDHYSPQKPVPPYRISVPTRGVFCEAVQGSCSACEKVEINTSQDWERFKPDEPTTVNPVTIGTPQVTEYKPNYKDFAQPIINIQNSPTDPAPGAGLGALSQLLGQSGIFKDITGLDQTQKNALETFKSTQESARAMAELAAKGAVQKHNTDNSDKIMNSLDAARNSGALDSKKYGELVQKHIEHQIDGGKAEEARVEAGKGNKPAPLTQAVIDAAKSGKSVKVQSDPKGNVTSLEVGSAEGEGGSEDGIDESSGSGFAVLAEVKEVIMPLTQESDNVCWAAVATMMYSWKQGEVLTPREVLKVAGQDYVDQFLADQRLTFQQKPALLAALGLTGESALTNYPLSTYVSLMKLHGPLWVTVDSKKGSGFSAHALILTKISGESVNNAASATFTCIDPQEGKQKTIAFLEYVKLYEQMMTDNVAADPYIQIVHFKDKYMPLPDLPKVYTKDSKRDKNTATNSSANPPIKAADTITIHKLAEADVVFYKGHLQICADGAPTAYHPKNIDEALDYLGNAGHDERQKKVWDKEQEKWVLAFDPVTNAPIMEGRDWYGVVTDTGKRSGKPVVNKETGYYISPTSLHYDDVTDRLDQRRYVNASEIPFIATSSVIYSNFPLWYGDFGLIYDTENPGNMTFAIVADGAPAHGRGEASIKAFDNLKLYPAGHAKNAKGGLGITRRRFLYVIFSHTVPGRDHVTARLTNEEIQARGAELLKQYGGMDFINQLLKMV